MERVVEYYDSSDIDSNGEDNSGMLGESIRMPMDEPNAAQFGEALPLVLTFL